MGCTRVHLADALLHCAILGDQRSALLVRALQQLVHAGRGLAGGAAPARFPRQARKRHPVLPGRGSPGRRRLRGRLSTFVLSNHGLRWRLRSPRWVLVWRGDRLHGAAAGPCSAAKWQGAAWCCRARVCAGAQAHGCAGSVIVD